jgi:hypothetical protein
VDREEVLAREAYALGLDIAADRIELWSPDVPFTQELVCAFLRELAVRMRAKLTATGEYDS